MGLVLRAPGFGPSVFAVEGFGLMAQGIGIGFGPAGGMV